MKIIKQFSAYSLGKMFVEGMRFLLIPLYTSYIPLSQYGLLNILYLIKTFLIQTFSLAFNASFMRYYFKDKNKKSIHSTVIYTMLLIIIILLAIAFIFKKRLLNVFFEANQALYFIIYLIIIIGFFEFINSLMQTTNILENNVKSHVTISIIQGVGSIFLIIYMVVIQKMKIEGVVLGTLITYGVVSIYYIFKIKNKIFNKPNKTIAKRYVKYGLPLAFASIGTYFIVSGDKLIIKYFLGDSAVGNYSFIYLLASVVLMFTSQPLFNIISPIIYKNEHDTEKINKIISKACIFMITVTSILWLLFLFFGIDILSHFFIKNKNYISNIDIILILSIASVFQSTQHVNFWGIILSKKTKYNLISEVIGSVINIAFNIILIPIIGLYGAAISTAASYLFLMIYRITKSEQLHKIKYPKMDMLKGIFAYIIVLGTYIFLRNQISINIILFKIFLILFFIFIITIIFKIINKNQIKEIMEIIKQKS